PHRCLHRLQTGRRLRGPQTASSTLPPRVYGAWPFRKDQPGSVDRQRKGRPKGAAGTHDSSERLLIRWITNLISRSSVCPADFPVHGTSMSSGRTWPAASSPSRGFRIRKLSSPAFLPLI